MIATTGAPGAVRELAIADALAWEATCLTGIAAGHRAAITQLWSCEPALVAPAGLARLPGFARACAQATDAGWPVHLRATGGDLVPQGPGIVNLTLMFRGPPDASSTLEDAYKRLTAPICDALSNAGISSCNGSVSGAFCDGRYNITVMGRKFAGTAQRWRPTAGGMAVQTHAMMLMRTPEDKTIDTLNRFYHDCGIKRIIHASAHVGLQDLIQPDEDKAAQHRFLRMVAHRAHLWSTPQMS
ncbi:lipoate--protein ligase family protein [Salipiger aestuarii]|uniref:lipoate--protein ligase family protein n=1 Tax=Salipiger aestuarii TaxID=568098 RepID=UPI001238F479|nr:lipoate--protein ligase family protein [Salipiger aestuarii]